MAYEDQLIQKENETKLQEYMQQTREEGTI